jgi:hypothetical protein
MALFKPYNGPESLIGSIPFHDGYVYVSTDDGYMYFDILVGSEERRVELNAKGAANLIKVTSDGNVKIAVSDLFNDSKAITVSHGGTGLATLDSGKVLVGNGTDAITYLKKTATTGGNAVTVDSSGKVTVGTLSLNDGGTGATSAADARTNLEVYSTTEVSNLVAKATTAAYSSTLASSSWTKNGDYYTQSKAFSNLACATNNVPPTIMCDSSTEDVITAWSTIKYADV